MTTWTQNPVLTAQLLEYEARQNPALNRRMAIISVLERRGFILWADLVWHVEQVLGAGVFGTSPQACMWSDIRALRVAGIAIGYSRRKGAAGYYLGLEAVSEDIRMTIEHVFREMDFKHLQRIKQIAPDRRIESVFEMIDFARQIAEDGQRARVQGVS